MPAKFVRAHDTSCPTEYTRQSDTRTGGPCLFGSSVKMLTIKEFQITQVDLDHSVADGSLVFFLAAARSTMEDKEDRLVVLATNLFLDVCLMFAEEFP